MATCFQRGQYLEDADASSLAESLHNAMDGCGTNEEQMIEILVSHNNKQRQQIRDAYIGFGDLVETLKSELSNDLEDCIDGLMTPEDEYDAKCLYNAIKGAGTCENTLVSIIFSRTQEELDNIVAKYKELYDSDLAADIRGDTDGDLENLLAGRVSGEMQDDFDEDKAEEQALKLQEAGIDKWGTDEGMFCFVLCHASEVQVRMIMHKYANNTGNSLIDDIDSELSGQLKEGLQAILKCANDRAGYFAERLHNAFSGIGTDEGEAMRILISRSQIDLQDIKDRYQDKYDTPLVDAISSEVSGDLERCFKGILEGHYVR